MFLMNADTEIIAHTTILPEQGFSQDFEIRCQKWKFYTLCVIIWCPVPIYSIVNFEILGCPKSE